MVRCLCDYFQFIPKAIVCDSTIENWLLDVEKSLVGTLSTQVKNIIEGLGETYSTLLNINDDNIETWMLETASDVVSLVTHIDVNSSVEQCFMENDHEQMKSMKELLEKIICTITSVSRVLRKSGVPSTPNYGKPRSTRGELDDEDRKSESRFEVPGQTCYHDKLCLPHQRQKFANLIALFVHTRDIIGMLLNLSNEGCKSLQQTFEWSSQVKYHYSKGENSVSVKVFNATFQYGMEFQGSCPRLVITPVADKYFVNLAQAVKSHLVGTCIGPSVRFYFYYTL